MDLLDWLGAVSAVLGCFYALRGQHAQSIGVLGLVFLAADAKYALISRTGEAAGRLSYFATIFPALFLVGTLQAIWLQVYYRAATPFSTWITVGLVLSYLGLNIVNLGWHSFAYFQVYQQEFFSISLSVVLGSVILAGFGQIIPLVDRRGEREEDTATHVLDGVSQSALHVGSDKEFFTLSSHKELGARPPPLSSSPTPRTSIPDDAAKNYDAGSSVPSHILLATNDFNCSVRLSATMKWYGHDVEVVSSASAMMERVKSSTIDIILLDLTLPDFDRVNMTELLGAQPPLRVVALQDEPLRSDSLKAGFFDSLSKKPTDLQIDTLIRSCQASLARHYPDSPQVVKRTTPSPLVKMKTVAHTLGSTAVKSKPSLLWRSTSSHALVSPRQPRMPSKSTFGTDAKFTLHSKCTKDDSDEGNVSRESSLQSSEEALESENSRLKEKIRHLKQQLQQTQKTLDAVVPPEYQQHIARNRHLVLGKVACRPLTVMFSDIRNFSRSAENLNVDALMEFVNSWLSFALPPVFAHGGFVDKFIGDSIMCIFAHDDVATSALEAVAAAVDMMQSLDYMKGLQGLFSCDTGVGINTGKCMMGVLGIETRMEPTVLGDAVNLASRTESLSKKYGVRILITEYTKSLLGSKDSDWVLRMVDHVYVVGKTVPVKIYEVIDGEPLEARRKKLGFVANGWWPTAISEFNAGHFSAALRYFENCLHVYPLDLPSRIYIQRCFENMQPEFDISTWQPIYPLDTKLSRSMQNLGRGALIAVAGGYFAAINAVAVGMFWYDKQQALRHAWRVPEASLQLTALAGGWIGGMWAMEKFRHKTKKEPFRTIYFGAVAGNVVLVGGVGYYLSKSGSIDIQKLANSPVGSQVLKAVKNQGWVPGSKTRLQMPIFFTSRAPHNWTLWMGKDKYENDELIKFMWPEDVWFHVDDLPSAHVYVRLEKGKTIDDIPEEVMEDCCQLVKANSIQGVKLPTVTVVYTPWTNLKKTQGMDVGQVSFHDDRLARKRKCGKNNTIIKTLEKTRTEKDMDLKALKEERDRAERISDRKAREDEKKSEKERREAKQRQDDMLHYRDLMQDDFMVSNKEKQQDYRDYEDSFM